MKLYLRKATENDVDILFKWANDEVVRKNSFSTGQIKYEDHLAWFDKLLKDSNRIQFILEQNDEGRTSLIGQIRIIRATELIHIIIAILIKGIT